MSVKKSNNVIKVRAELKSLIIKWGYEDYLDKMIDPIITQYIVSESTDISDRSLELAQLITFIHKNKDKPIQLSEVTKTYHKNFLNNTVIGADLVLDLEQWATALLNERSGLEYENFGIAYKEPCNCDIEPYTDDELAKILSYESKKYETLRLYIPKTKYIGGKFRNPYYGSILLGLHTEFSKIGAFKSTEFVLKGGKERKGYRSECEFLYDLMVIIGLFEPCLEVEPNSDYLDDEKYFKGDKYDRVRNCIDSYKRHISKHQDN